MRRSLWISVAAAAVALSATAWAGDEWDEAYAAPKLTRASKSAEAPQPERHRHYVASEDEGLPFDLSSDTVGNYFGLGDEFAQGENYNGLGRLAQSRGGGHPSPVQGEGSPAQFHEWDDQPEGYGSGHNHDSHSGYTGENVYGPMWGVPEDAVGLDGFSGNPYPGMIDGTAGEHGEAAHQHNHGSRESESGGSARNGDDVQRNHTINRPGRNDD